MFPNARLMAVAILAAIAGISCGLGLFATFRVNHEPLARLAEGNPPLQLGLDNRAPGLDARVPLEARLQFGTAAKLISVPMIVPTTDTAEQTDAAPAPGSAIQVPAADPAVQNPVLDSAAEEPAADSALTEHADASASDQSNSVSVAVAAVATEPSSAAPEPVATAPAQQEAVVPAQDQQPVATTQGAVQTAAVNAAADVRQPKVKPTKPAARKTEKPTRASRPIQLRRPTKIVRARRPAATVPAQANYQYTQPAYSQSAYAQPAYSQPTYTWADGTAQAAQPVTRVVVRRYRAAQKAAPVPSHPVPATVGSSNGQ